MLGFNFTTISNQLILASLVLLSACNYNIVKSAGGAGNGSLGDVNLKPTATIDWTLLESSVLGSCMSCHVGKTLPEMGGYNSVVQNINKIRDSIVLNNMPPTKNGYQPLSSCKKAILNAWIQMGTPKISTALVGDLTECKNVGSEPGGGNDTLPIDQAPITYQTLLTKILQPKCINCHNPDSDDVEAAGILFYPYSEISSNPKLWASPGARSKIVRSVTRQDEGQMPPPAEKNALTQKEVDFIIKWIDAGRPQ